MMIPTLGLSSLTIYHSIALAAAIVTLVYSVVSMMVPFSQLAIAEIYAVQDDNHKSNDVTSTASARTIIMMPSTPPIAAAKKNSALLHDSLGFQSIYADGYVIRLNMLYRVAFRKISFTMLENFLAVTCIVSCMDF